MKIVILDGYTENPGDLSWDALAAFGELTVYDRTPYEDEEIARRIGDAEIVFTNKCPIRRSVIDACPKLKYISVPVCHRAAAGAVPPCGASLRGGASGPLGDESRLVLLGLSAH